MFRSDLAVLLIRCRPSHSTLNLGRGFTVRMRDIGDTEMPQSVDQFSSR